MNRGTLRYGVALAATSVLTAFGLAPGSDAAADPVTSCTSTTGTIVAVDFHHWGGPIVRGCDRSNPSRGIDLLNDEGFQTSGDAHDGPQFVCRIGSQSWQGGTQYPTPSQDPCVVTPPASAYWSYWLAAAGQNSWSYGQLGTYAVRPKPGDVQLWIFGNTQIQGSQGTPTSGFPTCTPGSLRAGGSPTSCTPSSSSGSGGRKSTTPRGASHSTQRRSAAATHGATNGVAGSRATGGSAKSTTTAHATSPSTTSRTSTASDSAAPSSPVVVDAKPAAETHSAGSPVPLIVGLAIAAALVLGGGLVLRRRRHAD